MQKLVCAKKKNPLPNLKDILPLVNASYKTKNKCVDSAYKIFSLQLLLTAKPQNPDKGKRALGALFLLPEGYDCLHIRLYFKNLQCRVINSLLCYFCLASFFQLFLGLNGNVYQCTQFYILSDWSLKTHSFIYANMHVKWPQLLQPKSPDSLFFLSFGRLN